MRADREKKTFAYLRLSREEAQAGESASIQNQRMIISNYCAQNGLNLVRTFVDDGWSGGNFERPGFQEMMRELEKGRADIVITKDLSRLGRDMVEASYYAEQYYPEHGIRYIAIADNFDTEHENIMAPFQFAMNEVYLRDGSRKVKDVLRTKRERGQYCACPPYGYQKEKGNKNHLIPDEATAPVVRRIFQRAANGDSSRKIALDLNQDGIIPPLKYRVLYRDDFSEAGASRMSDVWNYTTVKRILKNRVYLGHTVLGRSRKVSVKSKKKVAIPKEDWAVTENTHEALVTQATFDLAQTNLVQAAIKPMTIFEKASFPALPYAANAGIPSAPAELSTKVNGRNTGIYPAPTSGRTLQIPVMAFAFLKQIIDLKLSSFLHTDLVSLRQLLARCHTQCQRQISILQNREKNISGVFQPRKHHKIKLVKIILLVRLLLKKPDRLLAGKNDLRRLRAGKGQG